MGAPGKRQIDWEEVRRRSSELGRKSEMNTRVANVPKYTAVKEGQQYPMGKRGQYKLFHEHVWPKGFTPQRRDEVSSATAGFINDEVGTDHSAHLQNKISESLFRSTIPSETLKALAEYGSINISEDTAHGEFDADTSEVRINPNVLGQPHDFRKDGSGTVASQITIHELGHLNDFLSDYDKFWKNSDNRSWYSSDPRGHGGDLASPALEGRAEGFRLANNRITRGMKRKNSYIGSPTAGYESKGFKDPISQSVFKNNRLKTFREQSGLSSLPVKETSKKTQKPAEQLRLPGID